MCICFCNENSSVQLLSRLFATPWTAACQASLSITNSQSLLKFMCIESVMPSNHLILCLYLLFYSSCELFLLSKKKKKKNDLNVFYLYIYSLPCLNEDLSNFPDLNKAIWSSLHKSALSTSWRTHGDGQLPALGKGASLLFAHCGFSLP